VPEIVAHLMELGITENDAAVYLHLLKSGTVSITDIAKQTGIQRPRVYDSVKRLVERGFVLKDLTGRVPKYCSTHPQVALTALEGQVSQKQQAIAAIRDELAKAYTLKVRRGVFLYKTPEAAARRIYELLTQAQQSVTILAVLPTTLPDQPLFPWKVLTQLSAQGRRVTLILSVQQGSWQHYARLATQKIRIYHYPQVAQIGTIFHRVDDAALCISPVERYDIEGVTVRHSIHFYQEPGMIKSIDLILEGYRAQAIPLPARLEVLGVDIPPAFFPASEADE
jgi:predicted DNA-binding transcriptional regulator